MIAIIIIWVFIFFISSVYGFGVFKLLTKLRPSEKSAPPLFLLSILGLAFLAGFLSILSIFYSIGLGANIIAFVGAIIVCLFYRKDWVNYWLVFRAFLGKHPFISVIAAIGFIAILIETVSDVKIYDTGLYHAQAIQWINNFSVVPGLGNLHQRFAFNNHSFLLEAFFNFNFLKIQAFHALNGYITLLFSFAILFYFAEANKTGTKHLFLTILLTVPLFFYRKFISSASPDIQVALITCLIFVLFLLEDRHELNFIFWSILILSAYLITVKQSSIPIALLPLYYIVKNAKSFKKSGLITMLGIGALFFVPYIVRNIFLSGYLVYPFSKIDLINVDWKIPKEYVDQMSTILKGWGRTKEWSIDKPFAEWFYIWFHKLTIFNKLSVIASFIIPIFFILLSRLHHFKHEISEKFVVLYTITFAYSVFWLLSVPELRFIFYIQIIVAIMALMNGYHLVYNFWVNRFQLVSVIISRRIHQFALYCLLGFVMISLAFSAKQTFSENYVAEHLFLPPKYPVAKTKEIVINNLTLETPITDQLCWDTCIPCSLIQGKIGVSPMIEKRGPTLDYGFRASQK